MRSARIVKWHKREKEFVRPYDLIFAVQTETLLETQQGITSELVVESCDEGILAKILVPEGENREIQPESPIAIMCEDEQDLDYCQQLSLQDVQNMQRTMIWQAYLAKPQNKKGSICGCD